ncbi:CPBP family intramembrane metalloprotease, partial [Eubacteriales bacterium OttesenSCG-928-A19]|nr:CPBP family intramembrane metalloprotease [Eubacteriales bacterium OttesenSCG-928-A19]
NGVNPELLGSPYVSILLNSICMYLIGFPLMLLILRGIPNTLPSATPVEGESKKLSPLTILALYPVLYAIMVLVSKGGASIEELLGTSASLTANDLPISPLSQWALFIQGVVVAPVMEEIICRRLVYRKASGYGKPAFVIWSAVVFGLFHMNFGQSIYAAILGAIFALIIYKTGSVLYCIVLHVAVNLTGGAGLGNIMLSSGNETAITVYTTCLYALTAVGTVIGIVMLAKAIRSARRGKSEAPVAAIRIRTAFLNPGSLVYCGICLIIIISLFFN